jgi:LPS sulfotransferase NodH
MTISDFRQTFVEAFQNWSFPPDELLSYRKLVTDHRPFLICITPRSGSTYLRDLLLQTRSAGRPYEFLNLDRVTSRLQKVNVAESISSTSFLQYLHCILDVQTPRGGSCGITTSYYQFLPLIETGLDRALFQDFRIIHLLRRQLVEQAVSLYLAVETGIFQCFRNHGAIE